MLKFVLSFSTMCKNACCDFDSQSQAKEMSICHAVKVVAYLLTPDECCKRLFLRPCAFLVCFLYGVIKKVLNLFVNLTRVSIFFPLDWRLITMCPANTYFERNKFTLKNSLLIAYCICLMKYNVLTVCVLVLST